MATKSRRKDGRVPLLKSKPENIKRVLDAIQMGMTDSFACDYGGIGTTSFYEYLARAEKDFAIGKESIYTEFANKVKKARADFQMAHLATITKATKEGTWQASAWLLERRFKKEFGNSNVNIDVNSDRVEIISDVPVKIKGE